MTLRSVPGQAILLFSSLEMMRIAWIGINSLLMGLRVDKFQFSTFLCAILDIGSGLLRSFRGAYENSSTLPQRGNPIDLSRASYIETGSVEM